MKYIKVFRYEPINGGGKRLLGHYIQSVDELSNVIGSEFDDIEYMKSGTEITLKVIEMPKEQYNMLQEFEGY